MILTACDTKPTDYSLQIYGDVAINRDTSKVQTVMITDRSLDSCYRNWANYLSVNESYSLNEWVATDILTEMESRYSHWGITWYDMKIKGFVKDPKSGQIFMVNKRYVSD
jgi:hypothetical protein